MEWLGRYAHWNWRCDGKRQARVAWYCCWCGCLVDLGLAGLSKGLSFPVSLPVFCSLLRYPFLGVSYEHIVMLRWERQLICLGNEIRLKKIILRFVTNERTWSNSYELFEFFCLVSSPKSRVRGMWESSKRLIIHNLLENSILTVHIILTTYAEPFIRTVPAFLCAGLCHSHIGRICPAILTFTTSHCRQRRRRWKRERKKVSFKHWVNSVFLNVRNQSPAVVVCLSFSIC